MLGSSKLSVETDCIRLTVGKAARVPDSEVVAGRLKLLAQAVGVKRSEVVEV